MPGFDQALGIHAQALLLRAQRAEVLAMNLANADTPNYKARDLDFGGVLEQHNARWARAADSVFGLRSGAPQLRYRHPEQASLDQNTVDAQAEHAAFTDNAVRYEASLRFVQGRFAGLMLAIRGE